MSRHNTSLNGKTILVSGASSGLGQACALAISAQGARVILTGRNAERLQSVQQSLVGAGHCAVAADLTDAAQRAHLVEMIESIDGAVFSAGVHRIKPFKFLNESAYEETFSINYSAPLLLTTALAKAGKIVPRASLVYIGSIAANSATVGNALYAGSKGALVSSVRVLALELAKTGSRANVISPGQIETAMTESNSRQLSTDTLARNKADYPLGQGCPDNIADAALFLLSDLSAWITGHDLVVDGGYTLG